MRVSSIAANVVRRFSLVRDGEWSRWKCQSDAHRLGLAAVMLSSIVAQEARFKQARRSFLLESEPVLSGTIEPSAGSGVFHSIPYNDNHSPCEAKRYLAQPRLGMMPCSSRIVMR